MALCPNCSAKILPDQDVCRACGEPVPQGHVDAPDPLLGRSVAGKYEIIESIGEGAMGRVYRARQTVLDKQVAIKVLHKHLAADPKVAKRFHREARAASRLSHPSSLQILDFGEGEDGMLYIAMELLDGDDLLTIIEHDVPFSPARVGRILGQVLSALHAAHEAGIIHRDLKPENVIVVPRGHEELVKVCDFGIAKIQEQEGGSAITVSGFVCGTPEFMAPEQARGEELDRRADIYAVGCMLYQMLTGELPFKAESALGIITKHLTEAPIPPRRRRPEWKIPEALERATLRAMSKKREERFADAPSMNEAIQKAVHALGAAAEERIGVRDPSEPMTRSRSRGGTGSRSRGGSGGSSGIELPTNTPSRAWLIVAGVGAAAMLAAIGIVIAQGEPATEAEADAGVTVTATADSGAAAVVVSDAGAALATDAGAALVAEADAGAERGGRRPGGGRDRGGHEGTGSTAQPPVMETPPTTMAPDPPSPEPSPGERAYEEGRSRFLANDVPGAIRSFEEAARLMPRNAQVHKQLGRAYMRAGDVERGRAAYRRYLELAPDAPDRAIVERLMSGG